MISVKYLLSTSLFILGLTACSQSPQRTSFPENIAKTPEIKKLHKLFLI